MLSRTSPSAATGLPDDQCRQMTGTGKFSTEARKVTATTNAETGLSSYHGSSTLPAL